MMRLNGRRTAVIGLLMVVFLDTGCGKQANVTVKGTVVRGGQPIAISKTGILQVTLQPDVPEGQPYSSKLGECDRATGQFVIPDVPPGKYKVGIEQFDPNPQTDKLAGKMRPDNSKIVREIDGKTPLTIDLDKPE